MPEDQPYVMQIDMSVLDALGMNLYSNAAAVLAEVVANSWDADATEVYIDWEHGAKGSVSIRDTGRGMSRGEINDRFLKVGYQKRKNEGKASPKFNRPFMGRKGIGKLSVFSIANTVKVISQKGGESNGFIIHVPALKNAIKSGQAYRPDEIDPVPLPQDGTQITLTELRSDRTKLTAAALAKRLARRFDVTTAPQPGNGQFSIYINDEKLTHAHRKDLQVLEYVWEIGSTSLDDSHLPKGIVKYRLPNDVAGSNPAWKVRGWIGTVRKPDDLVSDDEAGSLKNVIVLARNRPIQESILDKLNFNRVFASYVTGQVHADFLDLDDDHPDIATSDRQRLIEDDPRVIALQDFLKQCFFKASDTWTEVRPKREAIRAKQQIPELDQWVEGLPEWQRAHADKMLGTIASMRLETRDRSLQRAQLYKSAVLAFERIGLRQSNKDLEKLSSVRTEDILPILEQQSSYESALYGDIVKSRVESIASLRALTRTDELEKTLQEHIFKNLFLLDPSWEHATGSEHMEQDLRNFDRELFDRDPTFLEENGRVDIRYATAGGKHVIVELKRYKRVVDTDELYTQGLKYYNALYHVLDKQRDLHPIELVFVLGQAPTAKKAPTHKADEYLSSRLSQINGRVLYYDEMLQNAGRQYAEYVKAKDAVDKLNPLLIKLDSIAD